MMRIRTNMVAVLTLLAAALIVNGCSGDLAVLNVAKISKVALTYPKGGMVVTNAQVIADLTQAMRTAQVDNTLYDTAMRLRIVFYSNDTAVVSISAGGPLFRLGKNQYYDRSGKFQEIIRKLTERVKTPNQTSQTTGAEAAPQSER